MNKIYFTFYSSKDGVEYVFPCYGFHMAHGINGRVLDEFGEWHFLKSDNDEEIVFHGNFFTDIRITGEIINPNETVLITLQEAVVD